MPGAMPSSDATASFRVPPSYHVIAAMREEWQRACSAASRAMIDEMFYALPAP